MDSENTVGIDIGGSKIAAGLVRGSSVVQRNELATPKGGLAELLAAVRACVEPLLPADAALGACTPGLHDPRSGRISRADNVPALTDVDLAAELSALFGQPVSVANDADTAALAEFTFGAARDWDSVCYVTVSTGIGGGFVNGDGVLRGHGGAAAELGHLTIEPNGPRCSCGQYGCLERLASGTALAERASARSRRQLSAREVMELYRQRDVMATGVVNEASAALGLALGMLSQLFDPEGFVLGGAVVLNNPEFVTLLRDELTARVSGREVPQLTVAALGADAGVLGAAQLARRAAA